MRQRSANVARIVGLIMILMVSAWDMDAMRPHIAAHSWYTLAFVALFLIIHLSDYLTVGRLLTHVDALALAAAYGIAPSASDRSRQNETIHLAVAAPRKRASRSGWQRFLPFHRPQPSLAQPNAKLYTFTAVTVTAAQASGDPYPITQQRFIVEPE